MEYWKEVVIYIVTFGLYVLGTMFVTWGTLEFSSWSAMNRGLWLGEGLILSTLPVISFQLIKTGR